MLLPMYAICCRFLVRGWEVARERPTFRASCTTAAHSMGFPLLMFGFSFFLLAAWGSTRLLYWGYPVMGIIGIVFRGAAADFYGWMISLKVRSDRSAI